MPDTEQTTNRDIFDAIDIAPSNHSRNFKRDPRCSGAPIPNGRICVTELVTPTTQSPIKQPVLPSKSGSKHPPRTEDTHQQPSSQTRLSLFINQAKLKNDSLSSNVGADCTPSTEMISLRHVPTESMQYGVETAAKFVDISDIKQQIITKFGRSRTPSRLAPLNQMTTPESGLANNNKRINTEADPEPLPMHQPPTPTSKQRPPPPIYPQQLKQIRMDHFGCYHQTHIKNLKLKIGQQFSNKVKETYLIKRREIREREEKRRLSEMKVAELS